MAKFSDVVGGLGNCSENSLSLHDVIISGDRRSAVLLSNSLDQNTALTLLLDLFDSLKTAQQSASEKHKSVSRASWEALMLSIYSWLQKNILREYDHLHSSYAIRSHGIVSAVQFCLQYSESRFVRKCAVAALGVLLEENSEADSTASDNCNHANHDVGDNDITKGSSHNLWRIFIGVLEALEETQSHLVRPVLADVNILLDELKTDRVPNFKASGDLLHFSWPWCQTIFAKALRHSNGWIRLWAVETVLTVPLHCFSEEIEFLTKVYLPALDDSDIFWRLNETNGLADYLDRLGSFLNTILISINPSLKVHLYRRLLSVLNTNWSAIAIFFLSVSLADCDSVFPAYCTEPVDDFEAIRQIFQRIDAIALPSLKAFTYAKLGRFFLRSICWTYESLTALPSLLQHFPSALNIEELLSSEFSLILLQENSLLLSIFDFDSLFGSLFGGVFDDGEHGLMRQFATAKVFWSLANVMQISRPWDMLCEKLADVLSEIDAAVVNSKSVLDSLLGLWLQNSKCEDTISSLAELLQQYLTMTVFSMQGTTSDFALLDKLYFPCLLRLNQDNVTRTLLTTSLALFDENNDAQQHLHNSFLLHVSALALKSSTHEKPSPLNPSLTEFLQCHSIAELLDGWPLWEGGGNHFSKKEWNYIRSRFIGDFWTLLVDSDYLSTVANAHDYLSTCIECLDMCNAWSELEILFNAAKLLIGNLELSTESVELLNALTALRAVVTELKQSDAYLPATAKLFDILLEASIFSCPTAQDFALKTVRRLLPLCETNQPLGCLLSRKLLIAWNILEKSSDWLEILVDFCIFGGVPRRVDKITGAAYELLQEKFTNEFLKGTQFERPHLSGKLTRAHALIALLNMLHVSAKNCQQSAASQMFEMALKRSTDLSAVNAKSCGHSLTHRRKTRVVQLLLLLSNHLNEVCSVKLFDHCLDTLLETGQQYSIRLIIEWIMVRLCVKYPTLFNTFLRAEDMDQTVLCLHRFLPWCTSQNFAVRSLAIAALNRLWIECCNERLKKTYAIVEGCVNFDKEAGNSKRIIAGLLSDFYFSKFDATLHFSLETIFMIFPRKTGMPAEEILDFGKLLRVEEESKFAIIGIPIHNSDNGQLDGAQSSVYFSSQNDPSLDTNQRLQQHGSSDAGTASLNASTATQRKIDPLMAEFMNVGLEETTDANISCELALVSKADQPQFILIASLVDKVANLGGLCRSCEVFGGSKLVVGDSWILEDRNFTSLSLSAEKWIEVQEVRLPDLECYIEQLRVDGFVIVAAEQTSDSIKLDKFKFPPKTAILLGHEKEGVPVNLIRAVDYTVEIPQLGKVRSLNVHVTGAILMYSYAAQHKFL